MEKISTTLNKIKSLSSEIENCLNLIEYEIDSFLLDIRASDTFANSSKHFDFLQKIQEEISALYFKDKIQCTDKMRKFLTEFDRIDDADLRLYYYKKIKAGQKVF